MSLSQIDLSKIQQILAVVGAVAVGLPALLHAMVVFFKLIPGSQPDAILEKLYDMSQKLAELIGKFFPQAK